MLVVVSHHAPFGFWLCYLLLSSLRLLSATSLSFDFDFSQPGVLEAANISLQGHAHNNSGVIELTRNDTMSGGMKGSVGRASYVQPVAIWDEATSELASFTTTFFFQIEVDNANSGDGMAFFLAHHPSSIPTLSAGGNLGLFSMSQLPGTNATGDDRVVAVEFDTFLNMQYDTSSNHMGIDLNSLISSKYINTTTPGNTLTSGLVMSCRVSYDNSTRLLAADLQIGGTPYRVDIVADLRQLLPSVVAVGFSGATGAADELHQVLSWSFDSTLDLPPSSPPGPSSHHPGPAFFSTHKWPIVGGTVGGFIFFVLLLMLVYFKWWRTPVEVVPPHIPRRFSYDELVKATQSFAQERQLGKGHFATVYRGELTSPTRSVAIKRFKLNDSGLKKSFDDEITAISLSKHRYLVEFLGWCKDGNNMMLVYELVPGGNLNEYLHEGKSWLSWSRRYKIVLELAEVLQHLHMGCRYCVVHGDIKPPNILLDSNYAVKLSDFGLARLVDHGIGPKTTDIVIGTRGYMDPEFLQNGRRSSKSDVYSFGIVLIEIVSGQQPPAVDDHQTNKVTQLLIDVHNAYRQGTILDAADSKLRAQSGSDGHAQMERVLQVGLWCALLDPSQRPAIAQARSALQSRDVIIPRLSFQFEAGQSSNS